MVAAVVRDGVVENTMVVESVESVQSGPWLEFLGDAVVVEVLDGESVSPGWLFDPDADPRFAPPPEN